MLTGYFSIALIILFCEFLEEKGFSSWEKFCESVKQSLLWPIHLLRNCFPIKMEICLRKED